LPGIIVSLAEMSPDPDEIFGVDWRIGLLSQLEFPDSGLIVGVQLVLKRA
jgi:hypothetical protein